MPQRLREDQHPLEHDEGHMNLPGPAHVPLMT